MGLILLVGNNCHICTLLLAMPLSAVLLGYPHIISGAFMLPVSPAFAALFAWPSLKVICFGSHLHVPHMHTRQLCILLPTFAASWPGNKTKGRIWESSQNKTFQQVGYSGTSLLGTGCTQFPTQEIDSCGGKASTVEGARGLLQPRAGCLVLPGPQML